MAINRSGYTAGKNLLQLESSAFVVLSEFSPPRLQGGVYQAPVGSRRQTFKHLGNLHDTSMVLGLARLDAIPMRSWLAQAVQGANPQREGQVLNADFNLMVKRSIYWRGRITDVVFPAMDRGSKNPGYFEVTVAPDKFRYADGGGKVQTGATIASLPNFHTNDFDLTIDGLDCRDATKIDSFRLQVAMAKAGVAIKVTLPAVQSVSFDRWMATGEAKNGAIQYARNFKLRMNGIRVSAVKKPVHSSDRNAPVGVELNCRGFGLDFL